MLCLTVFELYSRWVPLFNLSMTMASLISNNHLIDIYRLFTSSLFFFLCMTNIPQICRKLRQFGCCIVYM